MQHGNASGYQDYGDYQTPVQEYDETCSGDGKGESFLHF